MSVLINSCTRNVLTHLLNKRNVRPSKHLLDPPSPRWVESELPP